MANADAHSRYGMDAFPRALEEEGLQVKMLLPLPLLPPASGEDETQSDVLDHHLMVITRRTMLTQAEKVSNKWTKLLLGSRHTVFK